MFLVLDISSPNAATLGHAARAVFSAKGGAIGRRAGNEWVLPDPHVSGRHARVRSIGGTFFLEDTESANGVVVNGTKLHPGEPFPLKEGDKIFIDPFEISVRIMATMPGAATESIAPEPPAQQPERWPHEPSLSRGGVDSGSLLSDLDLGGGVQTPPPATGPTGADGLEGLVGHGPEAIPADFNPLLDNAPASRRPAAPSARDLHSKPIINDAMRTPSAVPPSAGGGTRAIPSNWSLEGDEPSTGPVAMPPAAEAPPPRSPTPAPAGRRAASAAVSGDLAELMRGAGLVGAELSPEVSQQLGQVLRIVVDGLMEVLRSRGEIKSEFRLQQTTFKPRENNPLKFSANVEDALHNLLVKRNPAYLDTPAAFEDAFADVRAHQLAMLAGMRAAFDYMLERFSPQALREQFDAKPGRKVSLGFGAAGKYWENFEEYYAQLTGDADDCFRRLFGDQFARSYEEQLRRLRSTHPGGGHGD